MLLLATACAKVFDTLAIPNFTVDPATIVVFFVNTSAIRVIVFGSAALTGTAFDSITEDESVVLPLIDFIAIVMIEVIATIAAVIVTYPDDSVNMLLSLFANVLGASHSNLACPGA